jgi:putative molybdopterin biosynthesis protein
MLRTIDTTKAYTPEQVAEMLQLSKNTVYELINRGEIVAKKIGKLYRISAPSLSFFFTGLDYDLYQADQEDRKRLSSVEEEISKTRVQL